MSVLLTPAQRLQTRIIAGAAYPTIAALCRTLTWKVQGAEHYDAIVASGRQPIVAFWHGRILPAAYYFRRRGIVALTSANFDGQWTARILEHFGNRTVAGSTSRRGMRAMRELKREVERGRAAAFALDGPRGPARVVRPGAAWLAAATGNPVLLFHAEANRSWTMRSWDSTQIPRPFAEIAAVLSPPLYLSGTDDRSVERSSAEISAALLESERAALRLLAA